MVRNWFSIMGANREWWKARSLSRSVFSRCLHLGQKTNAHAQLGDAASPVYADGHIYCLSEKGKTTVIKAGSTFEVVAENDLTGTCKAGIAISNGRLFIRSDDTLYAIGKSD